MSAVTLEYRQINIGAAELEDAAAPTLRMETPFPVRTVVGVREGDEVRAFEVERVVEVVKDGESRLCIGRWVDADLADLGRSIGSEHLEPSQAAAEAAQRVEAEQAAAAAAMADQEPVDVPPSEPAAEASASREPAPAPEEEAAAAAAPEQEEAEGGPQMKKRKGRRRG